MPLNFATAGPYRHDSGVTTAPLPQLAVAKALDRYPPGVLGFVQAHLLRGMNHVVAGCMEATAAIDAALHQASGS